MVRQLGAVSFPGQVAPVVVGWVQAALASWASFQVAACCKAWPISLMLLAVNCALLHFGGIF